MLDPSTYRRAVIAAYCHCLQGMTGPMTIFDTLNPEGELTHVIESGHKDSLSPDQVGALIASLALCKVLVALEDKKAVRAAIMRVLLTLGPELNFEWFRVAHGGQQDSVVDTSDTVGDSARVIGLAFWWFHHKVERGKVSGTAARLAMSNVVRTCLGEEPDKYFRERFPEFMEAVWLDVPGVSS